MIEISASSMPLPAVGLQRQPVARMAQTLQFTGTSNKQDPQPGYGWRNLTSLLMVVGGIVGVEAVSTTVNQFHRWTEGQKFVRQVDRTTAKDQLLGQIARLDRELKKVPGVAFAENIYLFLLRFQLLTAGFSALPGVFRKTIRLDQVYSELHKRGITGKNLKVAVIDSGYNPGAGSGKNKVDFKTTDAEGSVKAPFDDVGHGTAVTNLITSACPDSQVLVIPFASDAQLAKMEETIQGRSRAYIQQCLNNPERLTLNGIRNIFTPMIRLFARGVRQAVDEGADVINMSLGSVENISHILRLLHGSAAWQGLQASMMGEGAEKVQAKMERLQARIKALNATYRTSETLGTEIQKLMRPWTSALDYAHQKGVAVIVSAGNDGGHRFDLPDILARINLLGAQEHPALIVVGSTRQNGEISKFTTEYNDKIRPWVAGNGSGELSTDIAPPAPESWKYRVPPLWPFIAINYAKNRVQYRNPEGTSFSAPDVAALYLMMKSANPNLNTQQAKQILKDVAEPAHFGMIERRKIRMEVVQRLLARQPGYAELSFGQKQRAVYTTCMGDLVGLKTSIPREAIDAEEQAELARRTGHGTVASRRLAAVEAAEKLADKP